MLQLNPTVDWQLRDAVGGNGRTMVRICNDRTTPNTATFRKSEKIKRKNQSEKPIGILLCPVRLKRDALRPTEPCTMTPIGRVPVAALEAWE